MLPLKCDGRLQINLHLYAAVNAQPRPQTVICAHANNENQEVRWVLMDSRARSEPAARAVSCYMWTMQMHRAPTATRGPQAAWLASIYMGRIKVTYLYL